MMNEVCKNCAGGFRCNNPQSPCCGYYCGEYPGTGKVNENWHTDWLAAELSRIDSLITQGVIEEYLYDLGDINVYAELRHIYSKALITYEMSQDEVLEVASNISDCVADMIVEIIEK